MPIGAPGVVLWRFSRYFWNKIGEKWIKNEPIINKRSYTNWPICWNSQLFFCEKSYRYLWQLSINHEKLSIVIKWDNQYFPSLVQPDQCCQTSCLSQILQLSEVYPTVWPEVFFLIFLLRLSRGRYREFTQSHWRLGNGSRTSNRSGWGSSNAGYRRNRAGDGKSRPRENGNEISMTSAGPGGANAKSMKQSAERRHNAKKIFRIWLVWRSPFKPSSARNRVTLYANGFRVVFPIIINHTSKHPSVLDSEKKLQKLIKTTFFKINPLWKAPLGRPGH